MKARHAQKARTFLPPCRSEVPMLYKTDIREEKMDATGMQQRHTNRGMKRKLRLGSKERQEDYHRGPQADPRAVDLKANSRVFRQAPENE